MKPTKQFRDDLTAAIRPSPGSVLLGDCLDLMRTWPDRCVDLVVCSPPYEAARTYGIAFDLRGQDWVDWAVARFTECVRVCRGMVCWVVEGQTRKFRWSATPALLMADLHRAGVHLRKPPIFHRVGIPGSGGPDWWRNDYEFIVCGSRGGKLPWSDSTTMGHPPKWAPGGEMSNRTQSGARKNQWGNIGGPRGGGNRRPSGAVGVATRPSHRVVMTRKREGTHSQESTTHSEPVLANPGNVIKVNVGGGAMGSDLAHENEAPFPERLVEWFIRSFCPPGGIVYDPFSGSGTTASVALKTGRKFVASDIRESQVALTKRRIASTQVELPCVNGPSREGARPRTESGEAGGVDVGV